jgi:hypothetical protein
VDRLDVTAALQGRSVGSGSCVAYVYHVTDLPHTSQWRQGERVRDANPPAETPIATFGANGRYENRSDGTSHAAVLIAVRADGLQVWDQWIGRTLPGEGVQQRLIRFKGGQGLPVDDGDAYYTVHVAETER